MHAELSTSECQLSVLKVSPYVRFWWIQKRGFNKVFVKNHHTLLDILVIAGLKLTLSTIWLENRYFIANSS